MPETRNQCRHIQPSGHRCASPSLRQEHFCYYHHETRATISKSEAQSRQGRRTTFIPLEPDTRTAIQLNLGEIIRRIASNELDTKRAGLLLYALQIASSNLPKPTAQTEQTVEDIVEDDTHGPLAPEAEFHSAPHEKSLYEILTEQWAKDAEDEATRATESAAREQAESQSEPWVAPPEDFDSPLTIRACATQTDPLNPQNPFNPRSRFSPAINASSSKVKNSKLTARDSLSMIFKETKGLGHPGDLSAPNAPSHYEPAAAAHSGA